LECAGDNKTPPTFSQGRNKTLRGTTIIPRTVARYALPASNKATTCNGATRPALPFTVQAGGSGASMHTGSPTGLHQPPAL